MFKSDSMRNRLDCIGCYPTPRGVEAANEGGADAIRQSIEADLATLEPADLLAVHVVASTLAFDAQQIGRAAELVA